MTNNPDAALAHSRLRRVLRVIRRTAPEIAEAIPIVGGILRVIMIAIKEYHNEYSQPPKPSSVIIIPIVIISSPDELQSALERIAHTFGAAVAQEGSSEVDMKGSAIAAPGKE